MILNLTINYNVKARKNERRHVDGSLIKVVSSRAETLDELINEAKSFVAILDNARLMKAEAYDTAGPLPWFEMTPIDVTDKILG